MATDATGTPTSPDNIPTYNTAGDPPSGKGFNAAMALIQTALSKRLNVSSLFTSVGDLAYASGAGVAARLGIGSSGQVLTVAGGVPTWAPAAGGMTQIFDVVVGRGNAGDPASPVAVIDSNTILGGNIPQTYNHLKLVIQARCDLVATFDTFYIRLNNDATANYDYERLYAQAAVANASENFGDTNGVLLGFVAGASAVAGGNSEFEVRIPNYTRTDFLKSIASAFSTNSTNATNGVITGTTGGKWRSTAAVTRIQLRAPSNLITGSRITLYGMS